MRIIIVISLMIIIVVLFSVILLINNFSASLWLKKNIKEGKLVDLGNYKLYASVKGKEKPVIVIMNGFGDISFEWYKIQDEISKYATVVTYDRAGYGLSEQDKSVRNSKRIAEELHWLLKKLDLAGPFIFVAHSLGGIYIEDFSRLYPKEVAGLVFIDTTPVNYFNNSTKIDTPHYNKYLNGKELKKLKYLEALASCGLLRIIGGEKICPTAFKALPNNILNIYKHNHVMPKFYKAQYNELKNIETSVKDIEFHGDFPNVPLKFITHSKSRFISEKLLENNRKIPERELVEQEKLWEKLTKETLKLTSKSEIFYSLKSSHYIHIEDSTLVNNVIQKLINEIK